MLRCSSNLLKKVLSVNLRNNNNAMENSFLINSTRKCHAAYYRGVGAPRPKVHIFLGDAFYTVMWWWVLWHLWHEHEHLTGEFEYPDPSKWSNKELGVPSDN